MKGPKHHHPVSCMCPQFCWPFPKPQCLSSVQCQLERGRNVQQLFAERSTVPMVWCDSRCLLPHTRPRENIHSCLGSKCQGCSPALSINKSMEWFTANGGKILCRSPFRPSISGGRREAVRANCVAVCYVKACDSWAAFRWGCLMRKCHVNPKLKCSTVMITHFPLHWRAKGTLWILGTIVLQTKQAIKLTHFKTSCSWQNTIMEYCWMYIYIQ